MYAPIEEDKSGRLPRRTLYPFITPQDGQRTNKSGNRAHRGPDTRRGRLMTSRRKRRMILLVALVALAMAILTFGAEVLDVFDLWSPRDD
jgi:hypothetical protein